MKVIVAGGGTGGHLYPAIALVKEIERRFPECEILFFGTARGLEAKILPQLGYHLKKIWLRGFQRRFNLYMLILPFQVVASFLQCAITIVKFKPDVVIGTGGYVSGPALFLAALIGYPTIIQEQNSYPGITTRFLARMVDQVHLSFKESTRYFKNKKKLYIRGNPIRSSLNITNRNEAIAKLGLDPKKKNLLVFGGSQGAHSINQAIATIIDDLLNDENWQIIWGTGELDYQEIQSSCSKFSKRVLIKPFITDMASAYAVADLVICRAGATTLAELQTCGLPVILVPFPFAAAGHQEANARALVNQHAAEMVLNHELDSSKLITTLQSLMHDEQKRKRLAVNLKALAMPLAAEKIIDDMMTLIKR